MGMILYDVISVWNYKLHNDGLWGNNNACQEHTPTHIIPNFLGVLKTIIDYQESLAKI